MSAEVEVARDLARRLAELVLEAAVAAVRARGRFSLALAGGSTPLAAYRLLGREETMPWAATLLLWGDERCVPEGHDESNAGAALEALGDRALDARVRRIPAELGADEGARRYAETLEAELGPGPAPRIDLVLLGLGPDGHTASLFPGDPALEVRDRAVAGVAPPSRVEPRVARVTLTLPPIEAAGRVVLAASGRGKAEVVRRALEEGDPALPAARVGQVATALWLLDEGAAAALTRRG